DRGRLPGGVGVRDEGHLRHDGRIDPHLPWSGRRVHGRDPSDRLCRQLTCRPPGRGAMSSQSNVLFDAPGPKARRRNNVFTLLAATAILGVAYFVYLKFDEKGQWSGRLWRHFLHASTWTEFIIPGLAATVEVAAAGAVFALVFGAAFGLARLSDHRWIRRPAGAVVEIFRAIPLLLLIFFIAYLMPTLFGNGDYTLVALVGGLTLYNGSVLAEVLRAGVLAVPRGQSEAAYAIGLRKTGVMSLVLLPQAVTVMVPAIVSQLVVLLKDTALRYLLRHQGVPH